MARGTPKLRSSMLRMTIGVVFLSILFVFITVSRLNQYMVNPESSSGLQSPIHFKNDYWTESDVTIVTAYFPIPSKHPSSDYEIWMENMLSLQDHMVIFTTSDIAPKVKRLRMHADDRTYIVKMDLEDLWAAGQGDNSFWEDQLARDPERDLHKSFEVFWIWLSKVSFVNEVIRKNPFKSDVFLWSDIGSFRTGEFNSKTLVEHKELLPDSAMLMMAHNYPKLPRSPWVVKEIHQRRREFFFAGAQMAGKKDAWKTFDAAYREILKGYISRKLFIGDDQPILQSTCMQNPSLCEFVTPAMVHGPLESKWFGLLYLLHYGSEKIGSKRKIIPPINHWDQFMKPLGARQCPSQGSSTYSEIDGKKWTEAFYKDAHDRRKVECSSLVSVDGNHGKMMCMDKIVPNNCLVYSFGSRNEISFEKSVAEKLGCEIHVFDCTIESLQGLPDATFHKWCISSAESTLSDHYSLNEMMEKLGHSRIDILKLDVENFEYEVLTDLKQIVPAQILVELHLQTTKVWIQTHPETNSTIAKSSWKKMWNNLDALGYGSMSMTLQGDCPCCAEFTLAIGASARQDYFKLPFLQDRYTIPLWQAWLGKHDPPQTSSFALATCADFHNNSNIIPRVITSDTASDWLDLHPSFELLDLVEQSDYLRIELLHNYGGFWLDADVVCLRNLGNRAKDLTQWEISGARKRSDYPPTTKRGQSTVFNQNTIGPVKANTAVTKKWHEKLMKRMDDLTSKLKDCTNSYQFPRTAGTSACGVRWGELVDFINDDLWPMEEEKKIGFALSVCDEVGRPLGFHNYRCDVFHIGQASGHAILDVKRLCELDVIRNSEVRRQCEEMQQWAFISKPRCASTFITDSFGFDRKQYHRYGTDIKTHKKYLACVRNPYDLVVSWWAHHKLTPKISPDVKAKYPDDINEWIINGCKTHWDVGVTHGNNPILQSPWLDDVSDATSVVRYENLETDLQSLPLPRSGLSRKNPSPQDVSIMLSDQAIGSIQDQFAIDFTRFGYDFAPPSKFVSNQPKKAKLRLVSKPKCGSNYISDVLFDGNREDTHRWGHHIHQKFPSDHILLCVRNPHELVKSWYTYHKFSPRVGKEINDFYPDTIDEWILIQNFTTHWGKPIDRYTPKEWDNRNPLVQTDWLPESNVPVRIIHIETLEDDLEQVSREYEIDLNRGTAFRNETPLKPVTLSTASERHIQAVFASDFERFGYETNVQCSAPQPSQSTVVTGLWDIKRGMVGDGRKFETYVTWMRKTLSLNASMVVFADASTIAKVRPERDASGFPTCYVAMEFEDHPYYARFYESNMQVVGSDNYLAHVQAPDRVEVVNPSYNILQWGKVELMRMAIKDYNPFNSNNVVWVDAGLSRFMPDQIPAKRFPQERVVSKLASTGHGLYVSLIPEYHGDWLEWSGNCQDKPLYFSSTNLFAGTVLMSSSEIHTFETFWSDFLTDHLERSETNNDQIMLQSLWCENPKVFQLLDVRDTQNWQGFHEALFDDISHKIDRPNGESAQAQGKRLCRNQDFLPINKLSAWTMLTDGANYVTGAEKLGRSILKHTTAPVDLVVMELENKPLSEEAWVRLQSVGWQRCVVERIAPLDESQTFGRFRDQFTKLHAWGMVMYDQLLYLDSDTLVIGSLDDLLNGYLFTKKIGVARDYGSGEWRQTFNMGVFLIRPDSVEYSRLINLQKDPSIEFHVTMAEQGFLNVVYEDQWQDIGFSYNANLAIYSQDHSYWKEHENEIRIVHYTMEKPWKCTNTYEIPCSWWENAP